MLGLSKLWTLERNLFKNVSKWVIFCDKRRFKRLNMVLMLQKQVTLMLYSFTPSDMIFQTFLLPKVILAKKKSQKNYSHRPFLSYVYFSSLYFLIKGILLRKILPLKVEGTFFQNLRVLFVYIFWSFILHRLQISILIPKIFSGVFLIFSKIAYLFYQIICNLIPKQRT